MADFCGVYSTQVSQELSSMLTVPGKQVLLPMLSCMDSLMSARSCLDFRLPPLGPCIGCTVSIPGSPLLCQRSSIITRLRMVVAFYCIGSLDLLGVLNEKTKEFERDSWKEWIWAQQISCVCLFSGSAFTAYYFCSPGPPYLCGRCFIIRMC